MVKTKSGFVLATAFLSGIAAALSLVSLGTEEWVVGEARFILEVSTQPSEIKYGLFSGTYFRRLAGGTYYMVTPTCILSENVCAYICKSDGDNRKEELRNLLSGECITFDTSCPGVRRLNQIQPYAESSCTTPKENREYINAGLYISTIAFLCTSSLFGVISAVLSIWNTAANPVEVFLSVYGLYIYNTIACVSSLLTVILWGAMFGSTAVNNIGITESIQGQMTSNANLGFSYWLNLPSSLLYFTSIAVLYIRQYLISQEPEIKIHTTSGEQDVGDIMIY